MFWGKVFGGIPAGVTDESSGGIIVRISGDIYGRTTEGIPVFWNESLEELSGEFLEKSADCVEIFTLFLGDFFDDPFLNS